MGGHATHSLITSTTQSTHQIHQPIELRRRRWRASRSPARSAPSRSSPSAASTSTSCSTSSPRNSCPWCVGVGVCGCGCVLARLGRTRSIAPTNIHHPPPKPETPKPTQFTSRVRRRLSRPLKRKHKALVKKLKKAKKEAGPLEKPAIIKTHLRDLVITPELIGSIVAIYNGKVRPRQTVVDPHAGNSLARRTSTHLLFFPFIQPHPNHNSSSTPWRSSPRWWACTPASSPCPTGTYVSSVLLCAVPACPCYDLVYADDASSQRTAPPRTTTP